jgi:uncharacterized membrane protein
MTMHAIGGTLMAIAGLFMLACGTVKSEFIIYRMMVARSRILWGDAVHRFYQVCGLIIMILGTLASMLRTSGGYQR